MLWNTEVAQIKGHFSPNWSPLCQQYFKGEVAVAKWIISNRSHQLNSNSTNDAVFYPFLANSFMPLWWYLSRRLQVNVRLVEDKLKKLTHWFCIVEYSDIFENIPDLFKRHVYAYFVRDLQHVSTCTSTHKQRKMHGCVLSTVATHDRVLKHKAFGIHSTDWIFIVLKHIHAEISKL